MLIPYLIEIDIDVDTFTKILWGNYFYNRDTRTFSKKPTKDATIRTFVDFILNPIYKIFSHAVSKEMDDLQPVL